MDNLFRESTIRNGFKEHVDPNYRSEEQMKASVSSILTDLFLSGVCVRCCFRYIFVNEIIFYKQKDTWLMGMLLKLCPDNQSKIEEKQSKSGSNRCVACLGIVTDLLEDSELFRNIVRQVKESGFDLQADFEDYSLAITVPTSILIRQHSLFIYLKERVPALQEAKIFELKDLIKCAIEMRFQKEFSMIYKSTSGLSLSFAFEHPSSADEYLFLYESEKKQKKKIENSIKAIKNALHSISVENFKKMGNCPPKPVEEGSLEVKTIVQHVPIYVAGRYVKLSREMSQSKWIIDGERLAPYSVEEFIAEPLLPHFQTSTYKFHSAGREDFDVRMLGNGRPFIIELTNPHKIKLEQGVTMQMIQFEANKKTDLLKLRDLQIVDKSLCSKLKEGEQNKAKSYRCLVWISKPIVPKDLEVLNTIKDLKVDQKTPIRVLQRRSMAVREKVIHHMFYTYLNQHFILLDLETQAGTYIKEFVHGDLGRTTPNFSTIIGKDSDILQLDVMSIKMEFPPTLVNEEDRMDENK